MWYAKIKNVIKIEKYGVLKPNTKHKIRLTKNNKLKIIANKMPYIKVLFFMILVYHIRALIIKYIIV